MKKTILMLFVAMCIFASNAFAELKEVRGVQTRSVSYVEYDSNYKEITKWGYELTNENNYDVWIELELKTPGFGYYAGGYHEVEAGVRDTKSITLKAGETYVWKCGNRMRFTNSYGDYTDYHEKFHVVYKAYKAE